MLTSFLTLLTLTAPAFAQAPAAPIVLKTKDGMGTIKVTAVQGDQLTFDLNIVDGALHVTELDALKAQLAKSVTNDLDDGCIISTRAVIDPKNGLYQIALSPTDACSNLGGAMVGEDVYTQLVPGEAAWQTYISKDSSAWKLETSVEGDSAEKTHFAVAITSRPATERFGPDETRFWVFARQEDKTYRVVTTSDKAFSMEFSPTGPAKLSVQKNGTLVMETLGGGKGLGWTAIFKWKLLEDNLLLIGETTTFDGTIRAGDVISWDINYQTVRMNANIKGQGAMRCKPGIAQVGLTLDKFDFMSYPWDTPIELDSRTGKRACTR